MINDFTHAEQGKMAFCRCGALKGSIQCAADALELIIATQDLDSETTKLLSAEVSRLRSAPMRADQIAQQIIAEDRNRKVQRSVQASEPEHSHVGPI